MDGLGFLDQGLADGDAGGGAAEQEALDQVAAMFLQIGELPGGLDALGGDFEFQILREREDGGDDGLGIAVAAEGLDEMLVDFQPAEGEVREIAERGIAGAEIVERHRDADVADRG